MRGPGAAAQRAGQRGSQAPGEATRPAAGPASSLARVGPFKGRAGRAPWTPPPGRSRTWAFQAMSSASARWPRLARSPRPLGVQDGGQG